MFAFEDISAIALEALVFVVAAWIFIDSRRRGAKIYFAMPWFFAAILFPVLAVPVYLLYLIFFGRKKEIPEAPPEVPDSFIMKKINLFISRQQVFFSKKKPAASPKKPTSADAEAVDNIITCSKCTREINKDYEICPVCHTPTEEK